jgi:hypothetical protein
MGKTSLKPLKATLEAIQEQLDFAPKQFQKSEEEEGQCGGDAKTVDRLSILPGPFH